MSQIKRTESYKLLSRILTLTLLLNAASLLSAASAYDWNRDYGVDATIGYDDNFRLREDDPIATTSTSVGVFADLQGTTEISNLRFAIGASGTQYSESSIEDSERYYLALTTARSGERWSGNLNLSLSVVPTTESELLDTGVLADGDRKSYSLGSGVSYQVDERNSIYANLSFSGATYDTVPLNEFTDNSFSMGWVNQFSETSDVSINGSVSNFNPDGGDRTTISGLQLGYGWSTSEVTRYDLLLGYQEVDGPAGTDRDGNSSFAINHSIDDRNNFSLFMGRGYVGSGSGDVRYQSDLNLSWNHALAERMQFTLTAQGVSGDDRDYIGIVAKGRHQYTREISLAASYEYRNQQRDSGDADSNSVSLSLSYSHF